MSKFLFGIFSGVFVGAVIYEFVNRINPDLTRKVEDTASHKIDDVLGVKHEIAKKAHAST